jgi:probable HAF family extracellular repeat protein
MMPQEIDKHAKIIFRRVDFAFYAGCMRLSGAFTAKEKQMRTHIAPGRTQGMRRHRWLPPLLAALLATASAAAWPAEAVTGSAAPPRYRVIQLGTDPSASAADINASGQVAFTDVDGANTRARFYDGRRVRDLGTLGGPSASVAALNDLGQVTGTASVTRDGGIFHPYRWSQATGMVDLASTTRRSSRAVDINNKGQVAGTVPGTDADHGSHGFFWSPQTGMLDIGVLDFYSEAAAINYAGTIAGTGGPNSMSGPGAFRWTRAQGIRDLGTIHSEFSLGSDINNAGHIAGASPFTPGGAAHAFLWTPRTGPIDLGVGSGGASQSDATRINEKDMVIGRVRDRFAGPTPFNHGFVWSRETGLVEISAGHLDMESFASDLNNYGQVVGGFGVRNAGFRAYLWTRPLGVIDLNTRLVGVPAGLVLSGGSAISDNGMIVASSNTGLVLLVPPGGSRQAPVVGPLAFSGVPRPNALLSFSANFTDIDLRDTHKARWTWGDGGNSPGIVNGKNGAGNVSGQHTFRAPGTYAVKLTVTDSGGESTTVQRRVVVSEGTITTRPD